MRVPPTNPKASSKWKMGQIKKNHSSFIFFYRLVSFISFRGAVDWSYDKNVLPMKVCFNVWCFLFFIILIAFGIITDAIYNICIYLQVRVLLLVERMVQPPYTTSTHIPVFISQVSVVRYTLMLLLFLKRLIVQLHQFLDVFLYTWLYSSEFQNNHWIINNCVALESRKQINNVNHVQYDVVWKPSKNTRQCTF